MVPCCSVFFSSVLGRTCKKRTELRGQSTSVFLVNGESNFFLGKELHFCVTEKVLVYSIT